MTDLDSFIDPTVPPSGDGCAECEPTGGWWVHLRRCARCGHIGCCDDSLSAHAAQHFNATGHRVIQSYEPGEDWFWDYVTDAYAEGLRLAPPESRPEAQGSPGPAGRVPDNWRELLAAKRAGG